MRRRAELGPVEPGAGADQTAQVINHASAAVLDQVEQVVPGRGRPPFGVGGLGEELAQCLGHAVAQARVAPPELLA